MKKIFIGLLIGTVIIVALLSFFDFKQVVGNGMEPTLESGQLILLSKYKKNSLRRIDVISYKRTNGPSSIGRIIGLPTESIRIENGHIYIDDNAGKYRLEEEYLDPDLLTTSVNEGKWFKINKFEYLVLPENKRENISLEKMIVKKSEVESTLLLKF